MNFESLYCAKRAAAAEQLNTSELYWRDKYYLLESRGYKLRPRIRPGWIPSWRGKLNLDSFDFWRCEDFYTKPVTPNYTLCNPVGPEEVDLIDARMSSTDELVHIRRMQSGSQELKMLLKFSDPLLRLDERNHCVPILDWFDDPSDKSSVFIVMPFLCMAQNPSFDHVEDFMEFGEQILEGLAFFHAHGIGSVLPDISCVKMDARWMFPKGFHPVAKWNLPDCSGCSPSRFRSQSSIKYYFSHLCQADSSASKDSLASPGPSPPSDPMQYDMHTFSCLVTAMLSKYSNFEFLRPLTINDMRFNDLQTTLRHWRHLHNQLSCGQRYWALHKTIRTDGEGL